MPEPSSCWVCHRSEAEVSAFADVETPRKREILQQTSEVTQSRADFLEVADAWRKGIPENSRNLTSNS